VIQILLAQIKRQAVLAAIRSFESGGDGEYCTGPSSTLVANWRLIRLQIHVDGEWWS
jgi:hypothetical protein